MNYMSADGRSALPGYAALIEAMPFGIVMYDSRQRLAYVNAAYHEVTGVPSGMLVVGSDLADNLRMAAHRGILGSGDPEAQVEQLLRLDLGQPHHFRRRRPDGRSFESFYVSLDGGAHMVCVVDTTQHVALREKAEKVSSQNHFALENLRNGIAVFGADRRLLLHNRRFTELIGLPEAGLEPGTSFWAMVQSLHQQEDYASYDGELFLAAQIALDRTRANQIRRVRGNGQTLEILSDPLPDGGWTMTLTDVSALIQAEEEGRRRAERLDAILRRIPHGICVWNPDRRVAMFNRAYSDIMRGAPVEVGERLEDVVRRRAEAGEWGFGDVETLVAQQMAIELSRPQYRRRRRPNGTTIDIRSTPMADGGHISVVTDATSLVEAEYEGSRRASEMDAMLASTRHGIIYWSADRKVQAFNRISETVQELPPGFLVVGRSFEDIVGELKASGAYGTPEQADAHIRMLTGRDPKKSHRRQRITPSGRVLDIISDPTPDGGWVSTYTDVTETRTFERELLAAREAAASAVQAKARFLATMSHELRTPLNAVIGFSDALVRSAQDATANLADVQEYGQAINGSGRQLLSLIDTILDVARLEAGQFNLANDRVDIAYLVRTCVAQAETAMQAAGVSVSTELPPDLPLLLADERRLRQVVAHLLSNAVKFTPRNGAITVFAQWADAPAAGGPDGTARDEGTAHDLLVCVADSGIGIPERDLDRVFEPFTQIDGTLARRTEGTGLGLYIGRALMRAHGGELELHSRLNEGTTAALRFPANRLLHSSQTASSFSDPSAAADGYSSDMQ